MINSNVRNVTKMTKKKLLQHIAKEHSIEAETILNNIKDKVKIKFINITKDKETVDDKERDPDKKIVLQ